MRRFIAVVVVLIIAAWIYHRHTQGIVPVVADTHNGSSPTAPPPDPTPAKAPAFDWQVERTDSFVLAPGVAWSGYNWPRRAAFRQRLDIEAKSPLSVGYIPDSYADAFRTNASQVVSQPIFSCLQQHVLRTRVECALDTTEQGFILVMWDERSPAQMAAAGAMAALGSGKSLDQAAIRNDVTIAYSELRCRNCQ